MEKTNGILIKEAIESLKGKWGLARSSRLQATSVRNLVKRN